MTLSCGACKGLCEGRGRETLAEGVIRSNPIAVQMLGVCSALAVTNRVSNSLVMAGALLFVCVGTTLSVALLRKVIPHRIRMMVYVAIIATFVILVDQFLKAYQWEMSRQLGPYVGLIITNCIVMGRAEAFASQNRPVLSIVDGVANGLGYGAILVVIGFFRELLGTGQVMGYVVLSESWYVPNQLMILAPGAFIAMGFLIALAQSFRSSQETNR